MLFSRVKCHLAETPTPVTRSLLELLVMAIQNMPETLQVTTVVLDCPPVVEGESLLPKTPHNYVMFLGRNGLVFSENQFSRYQKKAHLSSQRREATNTYDSYEQQQRPEDTLIFAVFGLDRVSHLPVTPQVILSRLINPTGKDSPKCAGNGGNNHGLSSAQAADLSFPLEEILITNHSAAGIHM